MKGPSIRGFSLHCSNHHLSVPVPEGVSLKSSEVLQSSKRDKSLMFGNLLPPSCGQGSDDSGGGGSRPPQLLAHRGTWWMDWWLICSAGAASVEMGLLCNSTSQETNRWILPAQVCFMDQMSKRDPCSSDPGFIFWALQSLGVLKTVVCKMSIG